MNLLYGLSSIGLSLIIGYALHSFFSGLPASLYGMIVFAALLHLKLIKADKVETSIAWILRNMGVCFVPAGVGIINHFQLIKQHGITLIAIIFVTTFILMTIVGISFQRLENSTKKQNLKRNELIK